MSERKYTYKVGGVQGRKNFDTTITARSVQDAVNKAARMYPGVGTLVGVNRVSQTGREYETVWVKPKTTSKRTVAHEKVARRKHSKRDSWPTLL